MSLLLSVIATDMSIRKVTVINKEDIDMIRNQTVNNGTDLAFDNQNFLLICVNFVNTLNLKNNLDLLTI